MEDSTNIIVSATRRGSSHRKNNERSTASLKEEEVIVKTPTSLIKDEPPLRGPGASKFGDLIDDDNANVTQQANSLGKPELIIVTKNESHKSNPSTPKSGTTKRKREDVSRAALSLQKQESQQQSSPPHVEQFIPTEMQLEFMKSVAQTKRNIMLTGVPGAGKSAVVSAIRRILINRYARKLSGGPNGLPMHEAIELAQNAHPVTAPTGLAAVLLGGITIHNAMGCGLLDTIPMRVSPKLAAKINSWEVVFLDEISMVHPRFFANMYVLLQRVRGSALPFGGVQFVFSGDFFQLPPVFEKNDPIIAKYGGKIENIPHLFETQEWRAASVVTIILNESIRQGSDKKFASLLNTIRVGGSLCEEFVAMLKSREMSLSAFTTMYRSKKLLQGIDISGIEPTILEATRKGVERTNMERLRYLGENNRGIPSQNSVVYSYAAEYVYTFMQYGELYTMLKKTGKPANKSDSSQSSSSGIGMDGTFIEIAETIVPSHGGIGQRLVCDIFNTSSTLKDDDVSHLKLVAPKYDYVTRRIWRDACLKPSHNLIKFAMRQRCSTPFFLHLKKGAQVTCTVNHKNGPVNGLRGVVIDFMTPRMWERSLLIEKMKTRVQNVNNIGNNNKRKKIGSVNKSGKDFDADGDLVDLNEECDHVDNIVDNINDDKLMSSLLNNIRNDGCFDDGMDACVHKQCPYYVSPGQSQPSIAPNMVRSSVCWRHFILHTSWPIVKYIDGTVHYMQPSLIELDLPSNNKKDGDDDKEIRVDAISAVPIIGDNSASNATEELSAEEKKRSRPKMFELVLPLRLAWAETIHGAQGQTLTYGYIDLLSAFRGLQPGQFYVAISRFQLLEDVAWSRFTLSFLKTDNRVVEWYKKMLGEQKIWHDAKMARIKKIKEEQEKKLLLVEEDEKESERLS